MLATALTTTKIIKGTMSTAVTAVNPVKLWGSPLKAFVLTHPAGFLAVTGAALVGLGSYYYATHQLYKSKEQNPVLVAEDPIPVIEESELL